MGQRFKYGNHTRTTVDARQRSSCRRRVDMLVIYNIKTTMSIMPQIAHHNSEHNDSSSVKQYLQTNCRRKQGIATQNGRLDCSSCLKAQPLGELLREQAIIARMLTECKLRPELRKSGSSVDKLDGVTGDRPQGSFRIFFQNFLRRIDRFNK